MASSTSYKERVESLNRRADEIKVLSPLFEEIQSQRLVDKARSCAIIGCGTGEIDLVFVEQCMPSLEVLSAVEPDAESVVELRANIARQLPNVRSTVYQDVVENWMEDNDQVFDVVTMIHCLTLIPQPARIPLFKRLYDSVIRPNGLFIVFTRTERLDGTKSMEDRIMEALNHRPFDDTNWYKEARLQLESVGFINCYESRYNVSLNLENLDRGYFAFFACECDKPISVETAEPIIRSVVGDTKSSRKDFCLAMFRKPATQ